MGPEFKAFNKIARWSREMVVTEKIDGTNAQVLVRTLAAGEEPQADGHVAQVDRLLLYAGSRNRWLGLGKEDNFGFAAWVLEHAPELATLGEGAHYGEFWGNGIQRRYGLSEKRFSLFNVHRWADGGKDTRPSCCHVVPVLARGILSDALVESCLRDLRERGSQAAPGFHNPEGIVIFHTASSQLYKKTLDQDGVPKTLAMAAGGGAR